MRRGIQVGIACLVSLVQLLPTVGAAADIDELVNQLTQSLTEDIQRQRLRAKREEAEELRRAQQPDLSKFGTPGDGAPTRRPSRQTMDCTTIDLGGGDIATRCD
jgi:hypothetical protein